MRARWPYTDHGIPWCNVWFYASFVDAESHSLKVQNRSQIAKPLPCEILWMLNEDCVHIFGHYCTTPKSPCTWSNRANIFFNARRDISTRNNSTPHHLKQHASGKLNGKFFVKHPPSSHGEYENGFLTIGITTSHEIQHMIWKLPHGKAFGKLKDSTVHSFIS